jgi:hypothetical protein
MVSMTADREFVHQHEGPAGALILKIEDLYDILPENTCTKASQMGKTTWKKIAHTRNFSAIDLYRLAAGPGLHWRVRWVQVIIDDT